jgi:cellulose synthase/poly-beta-1,6-N-acetylglucosamine synthase-like glycosyltransferase
MRDPVAVCILTLDRPEGLRRALDGVTALLPVDADISVVVVDNDPSGSARTVVEAARASMPYPVTHVVEERRGIPYGRNRAVHEARRLGVGAIAFVDDDEVPSSRWLRELLRTMETTRADAVMGPVLPEFETEPPQWVRRGRFFERRRRPTGTPMNYGTTSNVLITMDAFGDDDAPFAEWLGLNGGDDTHFFQRLLLEGRTIVWCDEAEVTETVPPSRVSASWLIRRRYRHGNTLSLCLRDLEDRPLRRLRRAVGASGRIVAGLGRAVTGLVLGRATIVAGLRLAAYGAGQLTGLLGRRYDEYAVIHGR